MNLLKQENTMDWNNLFKEANIVNELSDLSPEDKGDYFLVNCPVCGNHEAYVYKDNPRVIICNRQNKCGTQTDVWDYLKEKHSLDDSGVFRLLAEKAGFEISQQSPEQIQRVRKEQKTQDVLKAADKFFKDQLINSETEKYLLNDRGVPSSALKDFGHNPGYDKTVQQLLLKGFNEELVEGTLGMMRSRDDYKLVVTFYKPNNDILSFIGRRLNAMDSDQDRKYIPFLSFSKNICFGAEKLKNPEYIYIVEGYIDAIIMNALGLPTVALGSNQPSNGQMEQLFSTFKTKKYVLCLDNDVAGREGIKKLYSVLRKSGRTGYIADWYDCKDPNEYLVKHGEHDFIEQCKGARKDYAFLLEKLLESYDNRSPMEQQTLIEEVIKLGIGITDPIEVEDFNAQVESLTDITQEAIKETLGDAKRKKAEEELGRKMKSLAKDTHQLVDSGKPSEALKHLLTEIEGFKGVQTEAVPNTVYTNDRLVEELKSTPDGIKTGFRTLDKYITLPSEGVSIIAGVSRHGKTTAMLNMLNNALNNQEYSGNTFVYASFEETEKRLLTKLMMMNAREMLDEENNFSEFIKYLREGYTTNQWIDIAKEKILKWTQQGRLILLDMTGKNIETLENYVYHYSQQYEVGAVYIDYIQKIQAKESYTRQMELQKISHRILDLAKASHVPIVLGAQFNKEGANGIDRMDLNHIREANDIGNDAHLVLGIWNTQAAAPSDKAIPRNSSQPVDFSVKVLKNRNGASNMIFDLNLFPENFTILDKGAAYGQH